MSVPAMDGGVRKVVRDDETRRRGGAEEEARFEAAVRRRRRGGDRQPGDDAASQRPGEPPLPPPWMALATAVAGTPERSRSGRPGEMAGAGDPVGAREGLFPAGADVSIASSGRALHLRFTQGQWAGVELQAALHAGQIVVTLRPLNRQQHRRLCEARTSLCDHVAEETGQKVQLEIADATR